MYLHIFGAPKRLYSLIGLAQAFELARVDVLGNQAEKEILKKDDEVNDALQQGGSTNRQSDGANEKR